MSDENKEKVAQENQEAAQSDLPVYIQRENCIENEVNKLIKLGYTPFQITPVLEVVERGNRTLVTTNTKLVYHFIRKGEKK